MKNKIIVIVGPTAVGKTALSLSLAETFGGEIISADSMQVYKGLDIGTAKATVSERKRIPHHLIDIVDASQEYNLADFLCDCKKAADSILAKGKVPILVGGTGLYVTSFTENIRLHEEKTDKEYREFLLSVAAREGSSVLKKQLEEVDPQTAGRLHDNDLKRIIRALEIYHITGKTQTEMNEMSRKEKSPYCFYKAGLNFSDRNLLYERINLRVDQMMQNGFLEEVKELQDSTLSSTAYQAIGYRQLFLFLQGKISYNDALEKIKMESRRYAKRQLTWFRRDPEIHWRYVDLLSAEETRSYFISEIETFLNRRETETETGLIFNRNKKFEKS